MIELKNDRLLFAFPDVHPEAKLEIGFQRTFRIPDDGKTYSATVRHDGGNTMKVKGCVAGVFCKTNTFVKQ